MIAASLSTVPGTLDGIDIDIWMPWIEFFCGRTCILLWILYGNMVDFSFIVSLYVSNLPNVTIVRGVRRGLYSGYRDVVPGGTYCSSCAERVSGEH